MGVARRPTSIADFSEPWSERFTLEDAAQIVSAFSFDEPMSHVLVDPVIEYAGVAQLTCVTICMRQILGAAPTPNLERVHQAGCGHQGLSMRFELIWDLHDLVRVILGGAIWLVAHELQEMTSFMGTHEFDPHWVEKNVLGFEETLSRAKSLYYRLAGADPNWIPTGLP